MDIKMKTTIWDLGGQAPFRKWKNGFCVKGLRCSEFRERTQKCRRPFGLEGVGETSHIRGEFYKGYYRNPFLHSRRNRIPAGTHTSSYSLWGPQEAGRAWGLIYGVWEVENFGLWPWV